MEIRNVGQYDVAVFECPHSVISAVLSQGLEEANRRRDIVPEPLTVMPEGSSKNRFLVYCPCGYDLGPFEEKIRAKMYETAQTTD